MLSHEERKLNFESIDFKTKPSNNNGSFNIYLPKNKNGFLNIVKK